MNAEMKIHYRVGKFAETVNITITDNLIRSYRFIIGYDVEKSRSKSEQSKLDYEDSIAFNWEYPRKYKPYIGDIIKHIYKIKNISAETIIFSGENLIDNTSIPAETVKNILMAEVKK